jgi:heme/copper-type cytochrome/quinol oxidase subunit 1
LKLLRRAAFEWNWQDTRYVFSSFSVLLSVFFLYFIFAAVYYIYAKRTTNNPNIYFTRIHFWTSFLGISFYLWNHLSANSLTNPIQLKNAGKEALFHRVEFLNTNDLVIVVLLVLAQLLFIFSLIRPARIEGRDKQPGLNGGSKRT